MNIGMKGRIEIDVSPEMTAALVGSGTVDVLATPVLLMLMEKAAFLSVAPHLSAGETTVGTEANLSHTAATPVGGRVRVESALVAVDGRTLVFQIEAFDEAGPIGTCRHTRAVINGERFMARAQAR